MIPARRRVLRGRPRRFNPLGSLDTTSPPVHPWAGLVKAIDLVDAKQAWRYN